MFWRHQSNWIMISLFSLAILLSGCVSTWETAPSGTYKFTSTEIKKLPDISRRRILSFTPGITSHDGYMREQMLVRAQNLDGIAVVKQLAGTGDVLVINEQGKELKVKISEITEIQRISQFRKLPKKSTKKVSKEKTK